MHGESKEFQMTDVLQQRMIQAANTLRYVAEQDANGIMEVWAECWVGDAHILSARYRCEQSVFREIVSPERIVEMMADAAKSVFEEVSWSSLYLKR